MRATLSARQAVRPFLERIGIGETVLVGVSGGADSIALAIALSLEAPAREIRVVPVVLNHNLQEGSAVVADESVKRLTPLFTDIIRRDLQVEITDGLESSARRARYVEFDKCISERGAVALFLAHTLNDQAESVLLGFARGSGARSIAGMRPIYGKYRRPFLSLTRSDTEAVCQENGVEYWIDPHNSDSQFARVRVRQELLPLFEKLLGPGITEALARTATLLQKDSDALEQLAAQALASNPDLDCAALAVLPEAIRARALRSAIYAAGAPSGSLTADHLAPVEALVTDWRGQGEISLPGGVRVGRISGRLSLSQQKENRGPSH